MASEEEDDKIECIPNVNKEQENYIINVYKENEHILNNKNESFENKIKSMIKVWRSIGELNLSQFDPRHVVQIMDWAKLHALDIVLTAEWNAYRVVCQDRLLWEVEKAHNGLLKLNGGFATRCKLADVVRNPWEDPILMKIMKTKNPEIGYQEIEFFCMETAYLVSVRLKKLCESQCEDLALNLAGAFIKCNKLAKIQNFDLNASETHMWFIFDTYIALLYKFQEKQQIVSSLKELTFEEGLQLIKRFSKKRIKIAKIWKNCQRVAILALQMYISRIVLKLTSDLTNLLKDYVTIYLSLCQTEELLQEYANAIRRISNLADASGLYIFSFVTQHKAGVRLKPFIIEMYIRGLTTDMNDLERRKDSNETQIVSNITTRLAKAFCNLGEFLNDHVKVARECVLTAFSLEPTEERMKMIENLARRSGYEVLDTGQAWKCKSHPPALPSDDLMWQCPDCGDWMCKPQLKLTKINMALSEALSNSVLGISQALCDDLVVCLSNPRYQILSWFLPWSDLQKICLLYLRDPQATKNFITELKFVDIDYTQFKDIKPEPLDDLNGIERGYEQYIDINMVSGEETDTSSEDSIVPYPPTFNLGIDDAEGANLISTLPVQQKSDPVILKSLRMFRPNLKRKEKIESDQATPKKVSKKDTTCSVNNNSKLNLSRNLSDYLNSVQSGNISKSETVNTQKSEPKNVQSATLPQPCGQVAGNKLKSAQVNVQPLSLGQLKPISLDQLKNLKEKQLEFQPISLDQLKKLQQTQATVQAHSLNRLKTLQQKQPEVPPSSLDQLKTLQQKQPEFQPINLDQVKKLKQKQAEVQPPSLDQLKTLQQKQPEVRPPSLDQLKTLQQKQLKLQPPSLDQLKRLQQKQPEVQPPSLDHLKTLQQKQPEIQPPSLDQLKMLNTKQPDIQSPSLNHLKKLKQTQATVQAPSLDQSKTLQHKQPEVQPPGLDQLKTLPQKQTEVQPPTLDQLKTLQHKQPEVQSPSLDQLKTLNTKQPDIQPPNLNQLKTLQQKQTEVQPHSWDQLETLQHKQPEVQLSGLDQLKTLNQKQPDVQPSDLDQLKTLQQKQPEVRPPSLDQLKTLQQKQTKVQLPSLDQLKKTLQHKQPEVQLSGLDQLKTLQQKQTEVQPPSLDQLKTLQQKQPEVRPPSLDQLKTLNTKQPDIQPPNFDQLNMLKQQTKVQPPSLDQLKKTLQHKQPEVRPPSLDQLKTLQQKQAIVQPPNFDQLNTLKQQTKVQPPSLDQLKKTLQHKQPEVQLSGLDQLKTLNTKQPDVQPPDLDQLKTLQQKQPEVRPPSLDQLKTMQQKQPEVRPPSLDQLKTLQQKQAKVQPPNFDQLNMLKQQQTKVQPPSLDQLKTLKQQQLEAQPPSLDQLKTLKQKQLEVQPPNLDQLKTSQQKQLEVQVVTPCNQKNNIIADMKKKELKIELLNKPLRNGFKESDSHNLSEINVQPIPLLLNPKIPPVIKSPSKSDHISPTTAKINLKKLIIPIQDILAQQEKQVTPLAQTLNHDQQKKQEKIDPTQSQNLETEVENLPSSILPENVKTDKIPFMPETLKYLKMEMESQEPPRIRFSESCQLQQKPGENPPNSHGLVQSALAPINNCPVTAQIPSNKIHTLPNKMENLSINNQKIKLNPQLHPQCANRLSIREIKDSQKGCHTVTPPVPQINLPNNLVQVNNSPTSEQKVKADVQSQKILPDQNQPQKPTVIQPLPPRVAYQEIIQPIQKNCKAAPSPTHQVHLNTSQSEVKNLLIIKEQKLKADDQSRKILPEQNQSQNSTAVQPSRPTVAHQEAIQPIHEIKKIPEICPTHQIHLNTSQAEMKHLPNSEQKVVTDVQSQQILPEQNQSSESTVLPLLRPTVANQVAIQSIHEMNKIQEKCKPAQSLPHQVHLNTSQVEIKQLPTSEQKMVAVLQEQIQIPTALQPLKPTIANQEAIQPIHETKKIQENRTAAPSLTHPVHLNTSKAERKDLPISEQKVKADVQPQKILPEQNQSPKLTVTQPLRPTVVHQDVIQPINETKELNEKCKLAQSLPPQVHLNTFQADMKPTSTSGQKMVADVHSQKILQEQKQPENPTALQPLRPTVAHQEAIKPIPETKQVQEKCKPAPSPTPQVHLNTSQVEMNLPISEQKKAQKILPEQNQFQKPILMQPLLPTISHQEVIQPVHETKKIQEICKAAPSLTHQDPLNTSEAEMNHLPTSEKEVPDVQPQKTLPEPKPTAVRPSRPADPDQALWDGVIHPILKTTKCRDCFKIIQTDKLEIPSNASQKKIFAEKLKANGFTYQEIICPKHATQKFLDNCKLDPNQKLEIPFTTYQEKLLKRKRMKMIADVKKYFQLEQDQSQNPTVLQPLETPSTCQGFQRIDKMGTQEVCKITTTHRHCVYLANSKAEKEHLSIREQKMNANVQLKQNQSDKPTVLQTLKPTVSCHQTIQPKQEIQKLPECGEIPLTQMQKINLITPQTEVKQLSISEQRLQAEVQSQDTLPEQSQSQKPTVVEPLQPTVCNHKAIEPTEQKVFSTIATQTEIQIDLVSPQKVNLTPKGIFPKPLVWEPKIPMDEFRKLTPCTSSSIHEEKKSQDIWNTTLTPILQINLTSSDEDSEPEVTWCSYAKRTAIKQKRKRKRKDLPDSSPIPVIDLINSDQEDATPSSQPDEHRFAHPHPSREAAQLADTKLSQNTSTTKSSVQGRSSQTVKNCLPQERESLNKVCQQEMTELLSELPVQSASSPTMKNCLSQEKELSSKVCQQGKTELLSELPVPSASSPTMKNCLSQEKELSSKVCQQGKTELLSELPIQSASSPTMKNCLSQEKELSSKVCQQEKTKLLSELTVPSASSPTMKNCLSQEKELSSKVCQQEKTELLSELPVQVASSPTMKNCLSQEKELSNKVCQQEKAKLLSELPVPSASSPTMKNCLSQEKELSNKVCQQEKTYLLSELPVQGASQKRESPNKDCQEERAKIPRVASPHDLMNVEISTISQKESKMDPSENQSLVQTFSPSSVLPPKGDIIPACTRLCEKKLPSPKVISDSNQNQTVLPQTSTSGSSNQLTSTRENISTTLIQPEMKPQHNSLLNRPMEKAQPISTLTCHSQSVPKDTPLVEVKQKTSNASQTQVQNKNGLTLDKSEPNLQSSQVINNLPAAQLHPQMEIDEPGQNHQNEEKQKLPEHQNNDGTTKALDIPLEHAPVEKDETMHIETPQEIKETSKVCQQNLTSRKDFKMLTSELYKTRGISKPKIKIKCGETENNRTVSGKHAMKLRAIHAINPSRITTKRIDTCRSLKWCVTSKPPQLQMPKYFDKWWRVDKLIETQDEVVHNDFTIEMPEETNFEEKFPQELQSPTTPISLFWDNIFQPDYQFDSCEVGEASLNSEIETIEEISSNPNLTPNIRTYSRKISSNDNITNGKSKLQKWESRLQMRKAKYQRREAKYQRREAKYQQREAKLQKIREKKSRRVLKVILRRLSMSEMLRYSTPYQVNSKVTFKCDRGKTPNYFIKQMSNDESENERGQSPNVTQGRRISPLQHINPRVNSKNHFKSCCELKTTKEDSELRRSMNRSFVQSVLANVPGLNDLEMLRPSEVNPIVNVVQVSVSRTTQNIAIQNTSTQVSPHIQRIGQPRLGDQKPDPISTSPSSGVATIPTSTPTNTKNHTSQPSTLINILSQQVIGSTVPAVTQNNTVRRQAPVINILSQQIIRPSQTSQKSSGNNISTTALTTEVASQITQIKSVVTSAITSETSNVTTIKTTTAGVKSVSSVATGTGSTILQFICKSSLPKFQQAFGKTVYHSNKEVVNSSSHNIDSNNSHGEIKKTMSKAVPVNIQPLQGSVIYSRQVPVGQTISLIPPGGTARQVFRIATSNPEQISLVKDSAIHSRMSALLAAALQNRPKNTEDLQINCDETTKVTLTRPALVQNARIVKPVQLQLPTNVRSTPQTNVSSTTLEQLREFDMVYKQIKERGSSTTTEGNVATSENQEAQPQRISVTYVNQLPKYTQLSPVVVVTSYSSLQPAASPALSVTSQGSSSPCLTSTSNQSLPKISTTKSSKGKTLKSTTNNNTAKSSPIPKPQQKPQEDEHTTQRIFDILAEYAEQLRNSPDLNNKPAPRRRSNPPTNPSQSSKRKKSSSAKKSGQTTNAIDVDTDDVTVGSEDSSGGGIIQLSVTDDEQSQAATTVTTSDSNENSNPSSTRPVILNENALGSQPRNVIIADSTVGEALKMPNTAVIVPGSYIMPVSMVKGGQQIAVVSGGSKILATVPARSGQNMLLFQSFTNQNRKGAISAVKYSTVQPISGISSQSLAGVSAQPPVILPSNSVATAVALGQPITLKKVEERDANEIVLTISPPKEESKPIDGVTQMDSTANVRDDSIDIKVEDIKIEDIKVEESDVPPDNSNEKNFQTYQKSVITNSTGTSVIATCSNVKTEESNGTQSIINVNLASENVKNESKPNARIQSVLVTACTSNGPMFSHATHRYKKGEIGRTNQADQTNKEFVHNGEKTNNNDSKTYRSNTNYYTNKAKKACIESLKADSDIQKQAVIERELRLQKSLSEECEDLGVDEPSTSDLFPEADLLFDSNHSPSFDQTSQDIIKRSQSSEIKEVKHLFSDDETSNSLRSDLFEYVEYHTVDSGLEYQAGQMINNGNVNSNESGSSGCEDNTLLPKCTAISNVTLNSPISPEMYQESSLNKYKFKYSNKKKCERIKAADFTEIEPSPEEVTGNSEMNKANREDDNLKILHLTLDKNEDCVKEEDQCELHCGDGDQDSPSGRGARRSVRKLCSCCNGSQDSSNISKKRPHSSRPQTPSLHKKAFLGKKR